MDNTNLNPLNRRDNIKMLRRYMRLTQKDFIEMFIVDESGKPSMSVAAFSNLESKGGTKLNEAIATVSERLHLDPMMFSMEPAKFTDSLDFVLDNGMEISHKKSDTSQLIHRLSMYLADQMFDGKLKKNEQIESDRVLAEKLGVGRSAIREALKVLDVLGMIDIRPGQGSYLSGGEENFFNIPLSWSLFLNGNQTEDIVELRNLLEVKAAALAATCTNQEKINKLEEIAMRMQKSFETKNYREFLQDDIVFHTCIAECSGNQVIFNMLQTIRNFMKHISQTGMVDEIQLEEIYKEHQLIYSAIRERNSELAENAMNVHMQKSSKRYNY